ncbi:MAG: hypothetical protein AAF959_04795 [Cyanobacteria bacterium P01_D01_bin.56]
MPPSPTPRPTANFFSSATLLFGGSFSGTHLTALVAPYSQLSGLVGFLMFPIAFIASMQLWPWVSSLVAKSPLTSRQARPPKTSKTKQRIIESFTFVLTSVIISIVSGLILTPPAMQVVVDPGYRILIPAGTIYGIICWVFIQLGYLQQTGIAPRD